QGHHDDHHVHGPGHDDPPRRRPDPRLRHRLRLDHGRVGRGRDTMTTTRERTRPRRRPARPAEITTPPAGTILPPHAGTGAPDIPVAWVTPALPPGWEPAGRTRAAAAADGTEPPQGPPAPDNE